jgi:REP element-mobilizing transposase RayT
MSRMPRIARSLHPDGIHHVFARGATRQALFVDDLDRRRYLALLSRFSTRMAWSCLTYCLMGNHFHLVIEAPTRDLSNGMQRIQGQFAQAFNRRHRGSGHVFQGRFKAVPVEDDEQLWAVIRYVAQNPVEAGLCEAPELWPWSSHGAILNGSSPAWFDEARLFGYLGADGGDPRQRYAALVKGARPL